MLGERRVGRKVLDDAERAVERLDSRRVAHMKTYGSQSPRHGLLKRSDGFNGYVGRRALERIGQDAFHWSRTDHDGFLVGKETFVGWMVLTFIGRLGK